MLMYLNGIFCIICVFISMKVRFDNEFLRFLNSHSFTIYLMQKVVLQTFFIKKYLKKHGFIKIFVQFILILYISTTFDKYTKFIDNLFESKERKNKVKVRMFPEIKKEISMIKFLDEQNSI